MISFLLFFATPPTCASSLWFYVQALDVAIRKYNIDPQISEWDIADGRPNYPFQVCLPAATLSKYKLPSYSIVRL